MKKIIHMLTAIPLLLLALGACDSEGDTIVKTANEFKPFGMDGFVVGDKLDQYFDGKKVRELYGRAHLSSFNEIVFEKDETVMEFRAQSTGETVYTQTFNIRDSAIEVPKFYFDGKNFYNTYPRPTPAEGESLINFYFDFPASEGPVDVVAQAIEYYWNWDLPDPMVIIDTIAIPMFTNVQPGKWSEYMTLNALPAMTPSRPDAEFWPFISLRKAGQTAGYYTSKKVDDNMIAFELRESWMTEGKVQSIYIGWLQQRPGEKVALYPQQNLVEMFP